MQGGGDLQVRCRAPAHGLVPVLPPGAGRASGGCRQARIRPEPPHLRQACGGAKPTAETDILLVGLERQAAAAPDPTPLRPPPARDAAAPHGPSGCLHPEAEPLPGDAEMRSVVAAFRGRLLADDARARLAPAR